MKKLELIIDQAFNNRQIKSILRNHFKLSAAIITTAKKHSDGIMLNNRHATVNEYVKKGDTLCVCIHDITSKNILPMPIPLDILYEDEDILALNKPANMPTHPSQNHYNDTLANGVMYYYKNIDFTFRVITRLDRETSGVVLIAKNAVSAQILSQQMQSKKICKQYMAICHNVPACTNGTINCPIARAHGSTILRIVDPNGKQAITKYEIIKTNSAKGISMLKLFPLTGRTHQIRVHLSSIGCPIYGDDLYGSDVINQRTRLHCSEITFAHPLVQKSITVSAPIPNDMVFENILK